MEGTPRRLDDTGHRVKVHFRDYRQVNGLVIPFVLETRVLPVTSTTGLRDTPVPVETINMDKVQVNPILDPSCFCETEPESD